MQSYKKNSLAKVINDILQLLRINSSSLDPYDKFIIANII